MLTAMPYDPNQDQAILASTLLTLLIHNILNQETIGPVQARLLLRGDHPCLLLDPKPADATDNYPRECRVAHTKEHTATRNPFLPSRNYRVHTVCSRTEGPRRARWAVLSLLISAKGKE